MPAQLGDMRRCVGAVCGVIVKVMCNPHLKTNDCVTPISSTKPQKHCGEWGHRSPYLSHAKRALYHLS